jgi:DNA-binding GntR family transcriptional regulator
MDIFDTTGDTDELHARILAEIRNRICLIDYLPGTLLSENALATEFGVSRPAIRAILQRLEFEHMVARQSGGGVVVSTDDIKTVKEAFYLRIRLYDLVAEDSPQVWIAPDDIEMGRQLLERLALIRAARNVRDYGLLHIAYHAHFMKFVVNGFLQQFINQLYYQTLRAWLRLLPSMSWEEEMTAISAEMTDTIQFLAVGDLGRAALARRDHLSAYVVRLMDYLSGAIVPSSGTGGRNFQAHPKQQE